VNPHLDRETGLVKISWSKIRTQEECRQKAWLVADRKRSPVTDVRVFFQGNVVDQAMRRWLEMDHHPVGWMCGQVDVIMDELEARVQQEDEGVVRWKHRNDRLEVRQFCRECAWRLEQLLRQVALPLEFQPAVRFSAPMVIPGLEEGTTSKVLLVGEMDLLTKEHSSPLPDITLDPDPGFVPDLLRRPRLRVWDLKATRNADYWRKTVAQLVFYDIACYCMFGVPTVEAGLLQPMVDGQPYISFVPSDEDRTQMLTRIVTVAHQIMRGDNAPKADSGGCSYCEVRHACVKYQPQPGTNRVNLF
jgi:PD-(D/E)XK nuclease superfamily protein